MDKTFRDEQLARLHPEAQVAQRAAGSITREFSLYDIAIITRAASRATARACAIAASSGAGAAADIAVYRDERRSRSACSRRRRCVQGRRNCVARDGRIVATPTGGTISSRPNSTAASRSTLRAYQRRDHLAVQLPHAAIGRDELCACCNGGRLLPVACFNDA